MKSGKQILITGKGGQLAHYLENRFSENRNLRVNALSKSELDITQLENLEDYFAAHPLDFCINTAAYTNVEKAEEEQELCHRVNALGAKNVASVCQKYDVRLIHISTDYVFDGRKGKPYSEKDDTVPLNIYGKTKLAGEQYVLSIAEKAWVLRTSWLYSRVSKNFVNSVLKRADKQKAMSVVDSQFGNPTYAKDLADAIHHIICCKAPTTKERLFHCANEGVTNWYELAKETVALCNKNMSVVPVSSYPSKAQRPQYSAMEQTLFQSTFHYRMRSWQAALKECLEKEK